MRSTRTHRRARNRGFTLLEMMLVVVIMGILATVVVVNFTGQGNQVRIKTTMTTISQIRSALITYNMDKGVYPTTITELVATKQLERIPTDGWKRPIQYSPRDPSMAEAADRPYILVSPGPDGQMGTADDIDVWTMADK